MQGLTPAPEWITSLPIAHRGYHDLSLGRVENSLDSFQAAVDSGFGIECDLQVSSTGEPVVFHDPDLARMTGVQGNVREKTPRELKEFSLLNTTNGIHTLSEHLGIVSGKVPLVLELKGLEGEDSGFVEGVADALTDYAGQVCVMSFDHWVCAQFAIQIPDIPRGLTAKGGDEAYKVHMKAMKDYDLQFVSYGVNDLPNRFVKEMRAAGLPVISWTVRDAVSRAASRNYADQMTFEGFDPRERSDG